jgi:hypothetical protein
LYRGSKFLVDRTFGRSGSRSRNAKRSTSTMFGMISESIPYSAKTSLRNREGTAFRSTARNVRRAMAERSR